MQKVFASFQGRCVVCRELVLLSLILYRALVFISHGVTEHMGRRYAQLATLLADSGACVFGHDHGKYYVYDLTQSYSFSHV